MRVFIKELDILKINLNRLEKLEEYLVKSTYESYMYSDENIYQINSRQINKLMQYDVDVVETRLDNYTLLLDDSRYVKDDSVSHIPYNHVVRQINKKEYILSPLAKIKLVIETTTNRDNNNDNNNDNNDYKIVDLYFILNDDLNYFIRENIKTFLKIILK